MDNEQAELHRKATAAMSAAVTAAGQLAQVLIEARVVQLQRAAQRGEEQTRQVQAQVRAAQQADAAVWRAAYSPAWWRRAGAEDIARVWRAASSWEGVDPQAAQARRVVAQRLAERGVHVDEAGQEQAGNAVWLSEALDQAAVDGAAAAGPGVRGSDGGRQRSAAVARQEAMAVHVRAVWEPQRAERVISSAAWPALAYKLDQLQRRGYDVRGLLRQVPAFVDRAKVAAAFAYRVVDDAAVADDMRRQAGGKRAAERDGRTVEGEWQEVHTDPPGVAQARAEDARAEAETRRVQAADLEVRAAQVAAVGWPSSTRKAVAAAAAARGSTAQAAARGQVRPTPRPVAPAQPRSSSSRAR